MRTVSSNVGTLLALDNISYFYLITIGPFKNASDVITTLRHTPVAGGITIGGIAYSDNNYLVSVDPPRMSSTVDKDSYKIVYADNNYYWRPIFERGFSGAPVIIAVGFYNTSPGVLGGAQRGEPLLSATDTFIVYSGFSDQNSYQIDMQDNGEILVTLECSSPMGSLALSRVLVTTDDNLRQRFPNDNSFEQVFLGSKGIDVLWGKKTS